MSKNSAIPWCHHTLNFWWGCEKISPACANCYAETFAKRTGRDCFGNSPRYRTKGPWKEVIKWNKEAADLDYRPRVFVNSMSDIGEYNEQVDPWRKEGLELIAGLENLDFLLLTKRPQILNYELAGLFDCVPEHFWLGVTAENQMTFEQRAGELLNMPHHKFFISIEPMLSYIDLNAKVYADLNIFEFVDFEFSALHIIVGAESGHHARPMELEWARSIRDQCKAGNAPFFMKQLHMGGKLVKDFDQFPKDLQVREMPSLSE